MSYHSTGGSTGGGDWVTVGGFVAFTLQLLRLSIDFIQVATPDDPSSSATDKTKDPPNSNDASTSSSTTAPKSADISSSTTYGSVSASTATDQQGSVAGDVATSNDEDSPLLPTSSSSSAPVAAAPDIDEEPRRRKALRVHLLIASYSLLTVWFAVAAFWLPTEGTGVVFNNPTSLCLTSLCMAIEVALLYRDINKKRYGSAQRILKLMTASVLWILYVTCWLDKRRYQNTPIALADRVVLVAVSVAVLLVVVDDGWSTRLPEVRRRSSIAQRTISRRAFLKMLKPYFWPDASTTDASVFGNRVRAILTWICVIGSKVCGLVSPLYLGWATTSLAHQDYRGTISYSIQYCVISLVGTVLKECQSLVYLKVAQAAFVQLSETAFEHLHSLSLDFHLRKKLGQTLRSMDRGIAACDTLMKYLFLWLLPALAECITVTIIFALYFHYLPLAVSIFYFVFAYILWTILLTLWRKKFRKQLAQSDNEYHDIFTDSMVNFETVKFFTAEELEKRRFGDAVMRYQAGSVNVQSSLSFLNNTQQVILKSCLATALSLAAWGIKKRGDCCVEAGCDSPISDCCQAISAETCPGMHVGDFVAVLTYTLNLFAPLNFLGSVYNAIVMALVDLQSMSELLAENPDVVDAPDAIPLPTTNQKDPDVAVEFDNVFFHYPSQSGNKGLKGLSFKMKRGTTTAVVGALLHDAKIVLCHSLLIPTILFHLCTGPTGAGKTTVSRLLFRFYDVLGGAVKINGADVRTVSQQSLRGAIGVVPQAASMFNESMRYNLKYGKPSASQDELERAAKDSQLLEFIEGLDDGWETMVGDRGLKVRVPWRLFLVSCARSVTFPHHFLCLLTPHSCLAESVSVWPLRAAF
jgi:ATP-binding cassette, subfamily B, heavy metal transporter